MYCFVNAFVHQNVKNFIRKYVFTDSFGNHLTITHSFRSENTGKFLLRDLAALTISICCNSQHGALMNRFPVMMTPIGWREFSNLLASWKFGKLECCAIQTIWDTKTRSMVLKRATTEPVHNSPTLCYYNWAQTRDRFSHDILSCTITPLKCTNITLESSIWLFDTFPPVRDLIPNWRL